MKILVSKWVTFFGGKGRPTPVSWGFGGGAPDGGCREGGWPPSVDFFCIFDFRKGPLRPLEGQNWPNTDPKKMTQNGLELNFLRQFLGSFLDHFGFIYGHYFVNISPLFDPCLANFSSLLGHFKKFFLAGIKCFRLDLIYFRLE